MEENNKINNLNNEQTDKSSETVGQVPPSPASDVNIRTMESDQRSIKESGGGIPEPEIINPDNLEKGGPIFKPETTISDNSIASEPVDNYKVPIQNQEEQNDNQPFAKEDNFITEENGKNNWLIWLIAVVAAVIFGVLAYFYIWPAIFPINGDLTGINNGQEITNTDNNPIDLTPAPTVTHQSFFNSDANGISAVEIGDYNTISILTALQNVTSRQTAEEGELIEMSVTKNSQPAVFVDYINSFLPELKDSKAEIALNNHFEEDFTAFIYYESNKFWPGYVAKLKPSVVIDTPNLLDQLKDIENTSIGNFYLIPPAGDPSEFKTGPVNEKYSSSFAAFNQKPASFNYGLFGDYLIITTNYKGLLAAIEKLGL